jgi:hypothetical protein
MEPGATAVAIEDREIRDWWRSLDNPARTKIMDKVGTAPKEHQRLMVALLRAPTPLAIMDHENSYMRDVWKKAKRDESPDVATRIESDRGLVDTARRGLGHLVGIGVQSIGWNRDKVLRSLVTSPFEPAKKGIGIFGFTEAQAATMRLTIEKETRKRI